MIASLIALVWLLTIGALLLALAVGLLAQEGRERDLENTALRLENAELRDAITALREGRDRAVTNGGGRTVVAEPGIH